MILFTVLSVVVFIIVFSVTFLYPRPSPFFYTVVNKLNSTLVLLIHNKQTLRINLNIDGVPISSKSHTHLSHSQTSRLLTSSLSLGVLYVPVQRPTQCLRGV